MDYALENAWTEIPLLAEVKELELAVNYRVEAMLTLLQNGSQSLELSKHSQYGKAECKSAIQEQQAQMFEELAVLQD